MKGKKMKKLMEDIKKRIDSHPDESLDFFIGLYYGQIDASGLDPERRAVAQVIVTECVTKIWLEKN